MAAGAVAAPAVAGAETLPPRAGLQAETLPHHRMVLQLVGGKTATQIYTLSFHTVSPLYQLHVNVPDHRIPLFASRETFHPWHPLITSLWGEPRVRMLVRVKPDGSGPLTDMCGCC